MMERKYLDQLICVFLMMIFYLDSRALKHTFVPGVGYLFKIVIITCFFFFFLLLLSVYGYEILLLILILYLEPIVTATWRFVTATWSLFEICKFYIN
ncbi:hypothetical protein Hdeb2414_s0018g00525961 [Helianthus debilis subsp. tardiflorus]